MVKYSQPRPCCPMKNRTVSQPLSPGTKGSAVRRLRAAVLALSLAAVAMAASASPVLAWDASSFSSADESLLFSLTNQDRAAAGLPALADDSYLHGKARWRSQDMGDRDYFSHSIPPDGKMVFAYMQADGYCFKVAGENIGLSSYGDDVATARIEKAFMGSASHRENILGDWTRMGIGAYKAADGRKLYTVLFSVPCGARATPKPVKATPRPTPRPTVRPTATPSPSPSPVPTETPQPTASPSVRPSGGPGRPVNLRVREKPVSGGLLDSLFGTLFGGLFGW
jgi:uncharacterized protein YkwD